MNEKPPKYTPEEQSVSRQRGGHLSGQSRKGEMEKQDWGWEATKEFKNKAREEMEADLAGRKESIEELEQKTRESYASYMDMRPKFFTKKEEIERQKEMRALKKSEYEKNMAMWMERAVEKRDPDETDAEYRSRVSQLVLEKQRGLEGEYREQKLSKRDGGILKKALRAYVKTPKWVRFTAAASIATGVGLSAGWVALGGAGIYAGRKLLAYAAGTTVTGLVAKGIEKSGMQRWLEKNASKELARAEKKNMELREAGLGSVMREMVKNNGAALKEETKIKRRAAFAKWSIAGAAGAAVGMGLQWWIGAMESAAGEPAAKTSAAEPKVKSSELTPQEETKSAAVLEPEAKPSKPILVETVKKTGVWGTARELLENETIDKGQFNRAWAESTVKLQTGEEIPISRAHFLPEGTKMSYNHKTGLFELWHPDGKSFSTGRELLEAYVNKGKLPSEALVDNIKETDPEAYKWYDDLMTKWENWYGESAGESVQTLSAGEEPPVLTPGQQEILMQNAAGEGMPRYIIERIFSSPEDMNKTVGKFLSDADHEYSLMRDVAPENQWGSEEWDLARERKGLADFIRKKTGDYRGGPYGNFKMKNYLAELALGYK